MVKSMKQAAMSDMAAEQARQLRAHRSAKSSAGVTIIGYETLQAACPVNVSRILTNLPPRRDRQGEGIGDRVDVVCDEVVSADDKVSTRRGCIDLPPPAIRQRHPPA